MKIKNIVTIWLLVSLSIIAKPKKIVNMATFADQVQDAATKGNCSKLKKLLKLNPEMIDLADTNGDSLLALAIQSYNNKTITYLIGQGLDVNQKNQFSETPLIHAARNLSLKQIKQLIKANANIHMTDSLSNTLLWYIQDQSRINKLESELVYLQEHRTEISPVAAFFSETAHQQQLAESELIYSIKSKIKQLFNKQINILTYLLNNTDIDVNHTNIHGSTALIQAILSEAYQQVPILLSAQGKTNICNNHGLSALMVAAYKRNVSTIRHLVSAGAECGLQNTRGETALLYAAESNSQEIIKFLLQQPNVQINHADKYGNTALSIAQGHGYSSLVTFLQKNGAKEPSLLTKTWIRISRWIRNLFTPTSLESSIKITISID